MLLERCSTPCAINSERSQEIGSDLVCAEGRSGRALKIFMNKHGFTVQLMPGAKKLPGPSDISCTNEQLEVRLVAQKYLDTKYLPYFCKLDQIAFNVQKMNKYRASYVNYVYALFPC